MKNCGPSMPPSFIKEEAAEGHPAMKKMAKDMGKKPARKPGRFGGRKGGR